MPGAPYLVSPMPSGPYPVPLVPPCPAPHTQCPWFPQTLCPHTQCPWRPHAQHPHAHPHTHALQFVKVPSGVAPSVLFDLLLAEWQLPVPNLVVSLAGEERPFAVKSWLRDVLRNGLVKAAQSTGEAPPGPHGPHSPEPAPRPHSPQTLPGASLPAACSGSSLGDAAEGGGPGSPPGRRSPPCGPRQDGPPCTRARGRAPIAPSACLRGTACWTVVGSEPSYWANLRSGPPSLQKRRQKDMGFPNPLTAR